MINILIVDDETPSRKLIKNIIKHSFKENVLLLEAANGAEALKITADFKPDIILTDIRMPKMTGTELASEIIKAFPDCKIIFLTGFTDKMTLKTAIKLNAVDYIEKPIDPGELCAAIEKAIASLPRGSGNSADGQLLEYIFKNKALPEELQRRMETSGLGNSNIVAVIILPCCEYSSDAEKILRLESEKRGLKIMYTRKSRGTFKLLLYCRNNDIKMRVNDALNGFFSEIGSEEYFKCGVGSFENKSSLAYLSYENAVIAADRAFFHPLNTIVFYKEAAAESSDYTALTDELYKTLTEGKYDNASEAAESLFNTLSGCETLLSSSAKKLYYDISKKIYSFYQNYFISYEYDNIIFEDISGIFEADSIIELHRYMLTLIDKIKLYTDATDEKRMVQAALFYIEHNFQNPNLSIIDIVSHCNVNTNYLCTTFKKITGDTLNHYINSIRISEAKKLLHTDKNIAAISGLCGFNDSKYFCKVFGKYTGVTPTQFRKKYH
ncbi:MAG: response regulator [Clostridia bacterium]|nr:response regulator [Clostridia bacterium]